MTQLFRPKYDIESCLKHIRESLESGWTGTGPKCAEIEKRWCEFTGAKNSLFVNSATSALHLALHVLDLPKGSKVITTPLTFVSTNAVILYEGLEPVFCDVGTDLSLDFDSVKDAIEQGAKAIIWVHYGGSVSSSFYPVLELAKERGIPVIEDCAHAAGALYSDKKRVGSRKDTVSCFSFQSVKNLPTFDSGMLCIPDFGMSSRARELSWLGIDKSTYDRSQGADGNYKWAYTINELGWKYNGNDIAAGIALAQLDCLDRDNIYRHWIYWQYWELLNMPMMVHENHSSHHLFVVLVNNREKVIAALKAQGIHPGVHYIPNYRFPVFSKFGKSRCSYLETMADKLLSLPNHLELTYKDIKKIADVVNANI